MPITTFYPCNPSVEMAVETTSLCVKCVTDQEASDACTSTRSSNSTSNKRDCSVYCNTGCNTKCTDSSSQTVCGSGH